MFFFVMLVSASISVSVLVMVCSPVMKSNAEQQLVELSMAMDQLEEKGGFTVDEIVSIVNNSAYSLSVVDKNDSRVHDHLQISCIRDIMCPQRVLCLTQL